jgi:hypothetical protein
VSREQRGSISTGCMTRVIYAALAREVRFDSSAGQSGWFFAPSFSVAAIAWNYRDSVNILF